MKRKLIRFIAPTLLVLGSLSTSLAAPLGTAFTYQGRLDDGALPVNGLYDFNFKLFDAETTGTLFGPALGVSLDTIAVSNGVFSVDLDFGAVFNGDRRWLEISVNTNAARPLAALTPRQPLNATPYAQYAVNAGGVAANAVNGAAIANNAVTGQKIANTTVVRSVNGLTDSLTLAAGANITLGTVGNTLTISGSGPGAPPWLLGGNGGTTAGINFLGTTDNQPLELKVNGQRALRILPTATPSLIGGYLDNSISGSGSVIAGGGIPLWPNKIVADWSAISGGISNLITARAATVGGGNGNLITQSGGTNISESSFIGGGNGNLITNGFVAFIGGGSHNLISAQEGVIGGGGFNWVSGTSGTVGGGGNNRAVQEAVVGGGFANDALGRNSTIAGGTNNEALGFVATIAGGQDNTASGQFSSIVGGIGNTVTAPYASVGGGVGNRAAGQDAMVAGGSGNAATAGQSTIAGGIQNRANASQSTVSGGALNTAGGVSSAIGGGQLNLIVSRVTGTGEFAETNTAASATIAGGGSNIVYGANASIGGGATNRAERQGATVSGGERNVASGPRSTVGGGEGNTASAPWSTVPGGQNNIASGQGSFAAGTGARSPNNGSFVWADGQGGTFSTDQHNQFAVRASAGVMIEGSTSVLDLRGNGGIRVAGAGINTLGPAFTHRATVANVSGAQTVIDHPHCNNRPNAILLVTYNFNPAGVAGVRNDKPTGLYYTGTRWAIYNLDGTSMPVGAAYNVLVVNP